MYTSPASVWSGVPCALYDVVTSQGCYIPYRNIDYRQGALRLSNVLVSTTYGGMSQADERPSVMEVPVVE